MHVAHAAAPMPCLGSSEFCPTTQSDDSGVSTRIRRIATGGSEVRDVTASKFDRVAQPRRAFDASHGLRGVTGTALHGATPPCAAADFAKPSAVPDDTVNQQVVGACVRVDPVYWVLTRVRVQPVNIMIKAYFFLEDR